MNAPLTLAAAVPTLPEPSVSAAALPVPARSIIRFERVAKTFPARRGHAAVHALSDITLDVPEGAILGVIGRSGAGKSTLIRLVNGLEKPSGGRVLVDDVDIGALDEAALRKERRSIGMIFQHFNLLNAKTVAQNIDWPLKATGHGNAAERTARVAELLALVGLSEHGHKYPSQLSGGQKQRVGIARALAMCPGIMLFDEVTSALDPELVGGILQILRDLSARRSMTMIIVTHQMKFAERSSDRTLFFDEGNIVEDAESSVLFGQPREARTRQFLDSVIEGQ